MVFGEQLDQVTREVATNTTSSLALGASDRRDIQPDAHRGSAVFLAISNS